LSLFCTTDLLDFPTFMTLPYYVNLNSFDIFCYLINWILSLQNLCILYLVITKAISMRNKLLFIYIDFVSSNLAELLILMMDSFGCLMLVITHTHTRTHARKQWLLLLRPSLFFLVFLVIDLSRTIFLKLQLLLDLSIACISLWRRRDTSFKGQNFQSLHKS
jgi:hypothetical protein